MNLFTTAADFLSSPPADVTVMHNRYLDTGFIFGEALTIINKLAFHLINCN
jgi:hypothetical protein